MKNNADETISEKGIKARKNFKPVFYPLLSVMNPLKLEIEKDEYTKTNKPVIYVASHGFKDDALNTLLTVKDNAYLVGGNIDLFFNTLDGTCLWINGVILVDRFNKESKNAAKKKMERTLELGNSVLIFPEGTWDLSENRLSEDLYYGFYEVAEKTGALVVPVVTQFVDDKCYAVKGEAFDITKIDTNTSKEILNRIHSYINKASDLVIYKDSLSKLATLELSKLELIAADLCMAKYSTVEDDEIAIKHIENLTADVLKKLKVAYKEENQKLSELGEKMPEVNEEIFKRIFTLLHCASNCKKIVCVEQMRDRQAGTKYEILERHANFSDTPREELEKTSSLKDEWQIYREKIIHGTPYFYYEPEQSVVFKNPLVSTEEEVFAGVSKKLK